MIYEFDCEINNMIKDRISYSITNIKKIDNILIEDILSKFEIQFIKENGHYMRSSTLPYNPICKIYLNANFDISGLMEAELRERYEGVYKILYPYIREDLINTIIL